MTNDVWMCGERGKGNCRTEKTKLFLGRYFMLVWGRDGNFLFPCMILTWKRLKTGDCKDSDYGMEKPSSLWCLISLHVKIETITQTMSRADEFEKSIWKECSGQKNHCSTNYSNVPELCPVTTLHVLTVRHHRLQISIDKFMVNLYRTN